MAKAKETVETVENEVKEVVEKETEAIINKIKLELKEAKDGIHTIFTKNGKVDFTDGVAEVDSTVADEIKDTGLVK